MPLLQTANIDYPDIYHECTNNISTICHLLYERRLPRELNDKRL